MNNTRLQCFRRWWNCFWWWNIEYRLKTILKPEFELKREKFSFISVRRSAKHISTKQNSKIYNNITFICAIDAIDICENVHKSS